MSNAIRVHTIAQRTLNACRAAALTSAVDLSALDDLDVAARTIEWLPCHYAVFTDCVQCAAGWLEIARAQAILRSTDDGETAPPGGHAERASVICGGLAKLASTEAWLAARVEEREPVRDLQADARALMDLEWPL